MTPAPQGQMPDLTEEQRGRGLHPAWRLTPAEPIATIRDQHATIREHLTLLARRSRIAERLPDMLAADRVREAARVAEVETEGFVWPIERVAGGGVRL